MNIISSKWALLSLLVAGTLTTTGALGFGYAVTIRSRLPSEALITLKLAGGNLICPDQQATIQPGETKTIETGLCCSITVHIRGTAGSIAGQTAEFDPPVTGYGIACRGYELTLKQAANGTIIAEQGLN
jgi:hypothetical protein